MKYLRKITESTTYYEVAESYKKPYGDGGNRLQPNRHQVGVPKIEVHEDWRELTEAEQAVYIHPTVAPTEDN